MRVALIGTGHVGLVTCVTLAHLGHDVVGMDIDSDRVARVQRGEAPFYEQGMEQLLSEGLAGGCLRFAGDPGDGLPGAEVVFICVGTPANPDGEANLAAVERASIDIARHADDGAVVIEKSTVPAGTADRVRETLHRERREVPASVVVRPTGRGEGLAPGARA